MKSKKRAGYTLIELMMVVTIIGLLASIVTPRVNLMMERAYEGRARAQLGAIRSAIQLYYSATEGQIAYFNHPDGVASADNNKNLTQVLTPVYLQKMPVPYLSDHFNFVPGLNYDTQAKINMEHVPPYDIVFASGAPTAILVDRPYVYDPTSGHIYYCDGNYSVAGEYYFDW